jgi:hypothetical protein
MKPRALDFVLIRWDVIPASVPPYRKINHINLLYKNFGAP